MKFLSICVWTLAAVLSAKTASAQAGIYALFTGANLDTTQTTLGANIYSPRRPHGYYRY